MEREGGSIMHIWGEVGSYLSLLTTSRMMYAPLGPQDSWQSQIFRPFQKAKPIFFSSGEYITVGRMYNPILYCLQRQFDGQVGGNLLDQLQKAEKAIFIHTRLRFPRLL